MKGWVYSEREQKWFPVLQRRSEMRKNAAPVHKIAAPRRVKHLTVYDGGRTKGVPK